MSEYVDIYLKRNKEFIHLVDFSRSSVFYRTVSDYVPYEKVKAINLSTFSDWYHIIHDDIEVSNKTIEKLKDSLDRVTNMSGSSIQEKLEAIEKIKLDIDEEQENIDDLKSAQSYIWLLQDIQQEYQFDNGVYGKENELPYVYMGIEIGDPTEEDIET